MCILFVINIYRRYKRRYKQLESSLASPTTTKFEMALQEKDFTEKIVPAGESKSC